MTKKIIKLILTSGQYLCSAGPNGKLDSASSTTSDDILVPCTLYPMAWGAYMLRKPFSLVFIRFAWIHRQKM